MGANVAAKSTITIKAAAIRSIRLGEVNCGADSSFIIALY